MQKILLIVFVAVASATTAQAQSLKDMLYGGKLKMDSNAVLRKSDDYKAKIDTAQKKPADSAQLLAAAAAADAAAKPMAAAVVTAEGIVQPKAVGVDTAAATVVTATGETVTAPVKTAAPKTNTRLWKEYTDSLMATIKRDILPNKKIKKEIYNVNVAYEIDTNGMVNILNVTATPQSDLLQAQVKQLMESTPLQLNPMLDSAGKPKKANRSQNLVIAKD